MASRKNLPQYATNLIGKDRPLLDILKNREIFRNLSDEAFMLVKNQASKNLRDKIIAEMEAHALARSNLRHVAVLHATKYRQPGNF